MTKRMKSVDITSVEPDVIASGRLYAAAPDLLDALRRYVENDDIGARLKSPTYMAACAAIAKTAGEKA